MAGVGVKILLPSGDPNDIKTVEMTGWKGRAFVIPRGKLKEIKDQEEANRPGIYFLFGEGDEPSRPKVYIGESEFFYNRLGSHDENKEFWNSAVVFTGGLNKAHVKFLENKCLQAARKANRYELQNRNEPVQNSLDSFETNEAEDFFEKIKLILGLLGFALFQEVPKEQQIDTIYYFEDVRNKDGSGKGALLQTGEFVVYMNSLARVEGRPGFKGSGPSLRRRLIDGGVLKKINDKSYVFTKDYIFTSPSAASDTVAGRGTNGWICWKDKDGKTLDENVRK